MRLDDAKYRLTQAGADVCRKYLKQMIAVWHPGR
ncbi:hypothetical protein ETAA1_14170 [Urbifossiella limnaea]|uniref:Uncharacterized protein n=1 Tax=Urbifossiella limnaea TaxID=2528023 RepID=A0A517XPQ1_9BACT|nr:hypothetical protein ETAA1_14170 [Urbifossiella limnaea]